MLYRLAIASLLVASANAFSLQGPIGVQAPARATMARMQEEVNPEPAPAPKKAAAAPAVKAPAGPLAADIWGTSPAVKVQGDTLKTWDIGKESIERVQLSIKSDGRPIETNVELWHTPSYIPTKFRVYTEDGALRPVHAVIETPAHPKTVAVYNTGSMEFPFDATVANTGLDKAYASLSDVTPEHVQGGRITSYTFGADVESVQILLKTDEKNMKAKIELTQGPNQVKQIVEVYASRGYKNPFYVVIQTPGANNAIRVINENTVEFPFDAWVLPYETGDASDGVVMGGWAR